MSGTGAPGERSAASRKSRQGCPAGSLPLGMSFEPPAPLQHPPGRPAPGFVGPQRLADRHRDGYRQRDLRGQRRRLCEEEVSCRRPAGGSGPIPALSCRCSSPAPAGGGRAPPAGPAPPVWALAGADAAWQFCSCVEAGAWAARCSARANLERRAAAHLQQRQQRGEEAVAAGGRAERHAGGGRGWGALGPRRWEE